MKIFGEEAGIGYRMQQILGAFPVPLKHNAFV